MPDTDQYDSSVNESQESLTRTQLSEMDDDAEAQKEKGKQGVAQANSAAKQKSVASASAMPSYHTGGKVATTGPALLEKGEIVVPKSRASEYRKVFAKRGKEGKHKWGAND